MNALPTDFQDQSSRLHFARMSENCLDEVMEIELAVFPFPWTRNVFQSTIWDGYDCWVARDAENILIGYFVLMKVVDEAHLLTIAVRHDRQGQGLGRRLLDYALELAREMKMESMLLEVRPSNQNALVMYRHYGFVQIGQRKNYYAAANNTREDALVMRLPL
jgi:[ribosomal protein S18]-alanine N-acetyltransferase